MKMCSRNVGTRPFLALWLGLGLGSAFGVSAQSATLDAPTQAVIGSKVEVTYDGPGEQYDSVLVVAPDSDDATQGINTASITSGRNPVSLVMPDAAGTYELRYWSRSAKVVMGRRPIEVVDVETVIDAPERAVMGSPLAVEWRGPGNSYEQIQLHPLGAAIDAKPVTQATVLGKSPVQMNLPEASGKYELRYVTRQEKRVLATRPITLFDVETQLSAPDTAEIGATIKIEWAGPGNPYDQIALYAQGAAKDAKALKVERITSKRNPVPMRLPEEAGDYELRYLTARDDIPLASRPLRIGAVDASIDAPASATAATTILVGWTGPGNNYDAIGLFELAAADDAKPLSQASILSRRNPLSLKLPDVEGEYELRYRTTQSGSVLARRAIVIQPAGRLAVVFERAGELRSESSAGGGAVELILDASGSMLQRIEGRQRIEIARDVLVELVEQHLPEQSPFVLRVFGHKQANSCRTDLEIPLGPLNRASAVESIANVQAMNLAKTPIADSLAKVASDLATAKGPKTVVLITDGEETCDGDPDAVIRQLRAQGLDVQLSIVGFAIDDQNLKATFERWAEAGGGSYFDANSADELIRSLRTVISGPFRVLDAGGRVVGQGVIGGAEIVLPSGAYTVEAVGQVPPLRKTIEIKPRALTTATF